MVRNSTHLELIILQDRVNKTRPTATCNIFAISGPTKGVSV